MENLTSFISLLVIWGALYLGYSLSMKRYQEND